MKCVHLFDIDGGFWSSDENVSQAKTAAVIVFKWCNVKYQNIR